MNIWESISKKLDEAGGARVGGVDLNAATPNGTREELDQLYTILRWVGGLHGGRMPAGSDLEKVWNALDSVASAGLTSGKSYDWGIAGKKFKELLDMSKKQAADNDANKKRLEKDPSGTTGKPESGRATMNPKMPWSDS